GRFALTFRRRARCRGSRGARALHRREPGDELTDRARRLVIADVELIALVAHRHLDGIEADARWRPAKDGEPVRARGGDARDRGSIEAYFGVEGQYDPRVG